MKNRSVVFRTALPRDRRPEVEALFFFNPLQASRREGIFAAISQAGTPAIAENEDKVWIDVPSGKTLCLFACDERTDPFRVIGIALYTRPVTDTIWITHLTVDPAYSIRGEYGTLKVARCLVDQVMATALRIKGVTRIRLPYREGRHLRVSRPRSAMSCQSGG